MIKCWLTGDSDDTPEHMAYLTHNIVSEAPRNFASQTDVLLISPIYLGEKVWQEGYDQDFSPQSVTVSKELETVYERIAAERQIGYLRASDYVQCSEADQEHLNAQGHQIFAQAVYEKTERMLWKRSGWRQVV